MMNASNTPTVVMIAMAIEKTTDFTPCPVPVPPGLVVAMFPSGVSVGTMDSSVFIAKIVSAGSEVTSGSVVVVVASVDSVVATIGSVVAVASVDSVVATIGSVVAVASVDSVVATIGSDVVSGSVVAS